VLKQASRSYSSDTYKDAEDVGVQINEITGIIIDSAMKVHSAFGPGLLESAYKACLVYELRKRGLRVDVEVGLPLI
jgi:formylmethanofuran dehydrogenase subunit B